MAERTSVLNLLILFQGMINILTSEKYKAKDKKEKLLYKNFIMLGEDLDYRIKELKKKNK